MKEERVKEPPKLFLLAHTPSSDQFCHFITIKTLKLSKLVLQGTEYCHIPAQAQHELQLTK